MKFPRILLCMLVMALSALHSEAKKINLGNYIVYEGEYDKKSATPIGVGQLSMLSKDNTFVNKNGEKEPCVIDVLQGIFEGNHVTSAKIAFNSGVIYEGTVDYEIETQSKLYDKITYTLTGGILQSGNANGQGLTLRFDADEIVTIERRLDAMTVTAKTSVFNITSEYTDSYLHGFRLSLLTDLFESPIIQIIPSYIESSSNIKDLVVTRTNVQQGKTLSTSSGNILNDIRLQSSVNIGTRIAEKWRLIPQEPTMQDNNGKIIDITTDNGQKIIRRGDEILSYSDNKRVLEVIRHFDDAEFHYKDTIATIDYKNGDVFKGQIYSDNLSNDGEYLDERKLLECFLKTPTIATTEISPFTGTLKKANSEVENYKYGHSYDSIVESDFIGMWNVSTGKYPSFDKMTEEGYINIFPDHSYEWIIKQRNYGGYDEPAVFMDSQRCGEWKIVDNCLVLTDKPEKTKLDKRAYPSSIGVKNMSDIIALNEKYKKEALDEMEKLKHNAIVSSDFDIVDESPSVIRMFIGNLSYSFAKISDNSTEHEFNIDKLIGRWGVADENAIYDFNADGTYVSYQSRQIVNASWTESFTVCMTGTWSYEDKLLILISKPSESIVQAKVINPQPWAAARVPARNKELLQIAMEKQAEHRATDWTTGSFVTIVSWNDNYIKCKNNTNGDVFDMVRLQ